MKVLGSEGILGKIILNNGVLTWVSFEMYCVHLYKNNHEKKAFKNT